MSRFSDEEKAEIAFGSYLEMAKAINGMKQAIEYDITCSSEYKDEKAYYTDLLNNGGVIGEGGGRYKFGSNVVGDVAEIEDIQNALSEVQSHIDAWCGKNAAEKSYPRQMPDGVYGIFTPEVGYRIVEKVFRLSADIFSAATGINDSALDLKDNEFFFSKEGVTEENFLEKANSLLDSVKNRIKQLGDIWSEYSYNTRHLTDKTKDRLKVSWEVRENISMNNIVKEYREYVCKSLCNRETDKALGEIKVIPHKE